MRTVVVIPWRDSGEPHRRVNFDHIVRYYRDAGLPVVVSGDGRESGPFNRSAAYNLGWAEAGDPDVIVWNEADCLIPITQLRQAVALAHDEAGMVLPYTDRVEVTWAGAEKIHAGRKLAPEDIEAIHGDRSSIGQCNVTSRATMQAVGCWDEGYNGWGYDDNAMFYVFNALTGLSRFVTGPGVHLWHPVVRKAMTSEALACTQANKARYEALLALTDADEIKSMIKGGAR